mmetsp:Transcript_2059/g.7019  ORF Transcript_2059/g.7019 Transcript_2059/m.7019 type:complete len:90 (+) Transcript_2059:157-426(+)
MTSRAAGDKATYFPCIELAALKACSTSFWFTVPSSSQAENCRGDWYPKTPGPALHPSRSALPELPRCQQLPGLHTMSVQHRHAAPSPPA